MAREKSQRKITMTLTWWWWWWWWFRYYDVCKNVYGNFYWWIKLDSLGIIIIIISCHRHGYPWPSLATSPYRSSPLAGLQGLHPVSSNSCSMYVRAGRPAFARPYVGIHKSTSLMSSSLLLQQCPAYLVRLTWIVFMMGGRWPYSWCKWGVAARTCSILLATFLCNRRLASSPAVLLASN